MQDNDHRDSDIEQKPSPAIETIKANIAYAKRKQAMRKDMPERVYGDA